MPIDSVLDTLYNMSAKCAQKQRVVVRNTFLEREEDYIPVAESLKRAKSEPDPTVIAAIAAMRKFKECGYDVDNDVHAPPQEPNHDGGDDDDVEIAAPHQEHHNDDDNEVVPPPQEPCNDDEIFVPPLERCSTQEFHTYEDCESWMWGQQPHDYITAGHAQPLLVYTPEGPQMVVPVPVIPWTMVEVVNQPSGASLAQDDTLQARGTHSTASSAPILQPVPQPQTLKRTVSKSSGCERIIWHVDAKKLKSKDRHAVSPEFELYCGGFPCRFKVMICPTASHEKKGGNSFIQAKGKGFVLLKCEADFLELGHDIARMATLKYRIVVAAEKCSCGNTFKDAAPCCPCGKDRAKDVRAPITCNFAEQTVSSQAKGDEFDFQQFVDPDCMTFAVWLEVVPPQLLA